MGRIYEEFVRQLAVWKRTYAGRPRDEITHLMLLALEREGIVTAAYREDVMLHRLRSVPLSDEARDLIHHALVWTWKDEEMHAFYIRGALLKSGNPSRRLRAVLRQAAGVTGGWASSVRQHGRWSEAPLSRALATLITTARVDGPGPEGGHRIPPLPAVPGLLPLQRGCGADGVPLLPATRRAGPAVPGPLSRAGGRVCPDPGG